MKSYLRRLRFVFAAAVLLFAWVCGRSVFANERKQNPSLPQSCTVMTMSGPEREVHLKRLALLSRAASEVKISADGFAFQVDLSVMSPADLQGWASNEQQCCSFLQIKSRVVEEGKRADVHVVCPADLKPEIAQSFGLRARD